VIPIRVVSLFLKLFISGTGKSFIGALLTKVLHDHTDKVILVVCYTNHALDQFIEDLLKIGIPKSRLIRLGGKASTQTEDLTLSKQPRNLKFGRSDWAWINELKNSQADASQILQVAFSEYRQFYPRSRMDSIMDHIEITRPNYFYAFQVPFSNNGEVIVGKKGKGIKETYLLDRWMSGHDAGLFKEKENVLNSAAIWSTDRTSREAVVNSWIEEMLDDLVVLFHDLADKYTDISCQIEKKFAEGDLAVIKSRRIIACTTTGAAKYWEHIAAAKPGILVVEEAGEILESHILTALSSEINQMILIGDHKLSTPQSEGSDSDMLIDNCVQKSITMRSHWRKEMVSI
jgi:hypothetical protein